MASSTLTRLCERVPVFCTGIDEAVPRLLLSNLGVSGIVPDARNTSLLIHCNFDFGGANNILTMMSFAILVSTLPCVEFQLDTAALAKGGVHGKLHGIEWQKAVQKWASCSSVCAEHGGGMARVDTAAALKEKRKIQEAPREFGPVEILQTLQGLQAGASTGARAPTRLPSAATGRARLPEPRRKAQGPLRDAREPARRLPVGTGAASSASRGNRAFVGCASDLHAQTAPTRPLCA